MIGVKIEDLKIQWDSKAILTPAEAFTKRLLDRFGAYCRRTQANSIKQASRKRFVSDPGKPPVYHLGQGLLAKGFKSTIFFASDYRAKEVSIGPVLLNGTAGANAGSLVPQTLEKGGVAIILSGRRGQRKVRRTIQVRARPSAQPAFEKTIKKKLPELIAGGILGS